MKTVYDIFEIDINDKARLMLSELSRAEAKERLNRLRTAYGSFGLRYVMKREPKDGHVMKFTDPTTD